MPTGDFICPTCGSYWCARPACRLAQALGELAEVVDVSMRDKSYKDIKRPRYEPEDLPNPDPFEGLSAETVTPPAEDVVNHPSHYTSGGIETIDAIEAWGLDKDFCLANAVKYISRAGKKDPAKLLEDLRKARWYLDRRIKKLEGK